MSRQPVGTVTKLPGAARTRSGISFGARSLRRFAIGAACVLLVAGGAWWMRTGGHKPSDGWTVIQRQSSSAWTSIRRRTSDAWIALRRLTPFDTLRAKLGEPTHRRGQHPGKAKRAGTR
jgi:hypothetical protein